jgi:polyisoprenoid-binding protein YceI
VAIGDLTIRGKTMPVVIPFTLDIENKTAHMKGEVSLNRTNFGIGQGQWADESTVKHDVKVIIDLKAAQ